MRALLLATALCAAPALAQQNNWTIDRTAGYAVMEEVASLSFTVGNAAGSRDDIWEFTLQIPGGPYDVEGGTGPSGWRASNIDRKNKRVTFSTVAGCGAPGLRPGQSAVFEVRVTGVSAAQDVPADDLQRNGTTVVDRCATGRVFQRNTGASSWRRHALSAAMTVSPRALAVGGQVTVTLTVVNRSTATQSGLSPVAPTVQGAATFALVSGPTPAQVNNLGLDGNATFTWVYRATGQGVSTFTASARNAAGTVTSPGAQSLDVSVGQFPAVVNVDPITTTSGDTVTLRLQVSNNTASTITNVLPQTPTWSGSAGASATLLTGPVPASVDSLSAGGAAGFTYTFRVTGLVGDSLVFTAVATGVDGSGTTITSDPVRSATLRIGELALAAAPRSVLSGAGATSIAFTLKNGSTQNASQVILLRPDPVLFVNYNTAAVPAGWTWAYSTNPRGIRFTAATAAAQIAPGGSQTFTLTFTSIGTVTAATPEQQRAHVTFVDTTTGRTDTTVTVAPIRAIPDVIAPVAVASPGRVRLTWSNPLLHDGVVILRAAGAVPNTAPTQGRPYVAGNTVGNATVVYADSFSFVASATDTTVTNGATYYYRLFNHDEYSVYAPGNTPAAAPSNVLLVVVPSGGASEPAWCSSVGLPALQQPYTDLGRAVYQSNQSSYFTANAITGDPATDGAERWRPSLTRGVVQARPTAQRVGGQAEPSLFVGDQLGYTYRLSAGTGAIAWVGNGGAAIGEVVQAQATVAQRQFASAAFQAAYPTDLVFFATRNSAVRSSNSVVALRVDTGAAAWSYQPGNLDQVTAAPLFDYFTNTLWVGSLATAGPSLRVLDVNAPATPLLVVSDLGDVVGGVVRAGTLGQALVADRGGVARGYHLGTRAQLWQVSLGGAVTAPLVPYLTDFFASTATGVQRWHVDTATNTVTAVWAAPAAMRLPSSVRVDAVGGRVYVGDADGFVRRLDLATGALQASLRVSTAGGVGMPSLDTTAGLARLYVGTADGRLCALPPAF